MVPGAASLGFERAIAVVQDCKLATVQDFGSDFKVIFKWGKEHVAFDHPFEPRQVLNPEEPVSIGAMVGLTSSSRARC